MLRMRQLRILSAAVTVLTVLFILSSCSQKEDQPANIVKQSLARWCSDSDSLTVVLLLVDGGVDTATIEFEKCYDKYGIDTVTFDTVTLSTE